MNCLSLAWRKKFGRSNMIMLLAILTGAITSVAANFLHRLVIGVNGVAVMLADFGDDPFTRACIIFPLPFIGVLLSYMVQRLWCGQGLPKALRH